MTVRGLAAAILTGAIRRSGPQQWEWGEAILRELDFVENDWAALRWSIGGATAVLRNAHIPSKEPDGMLSTMQGFERMIRWCIVKTCALSVVEVAALLLFVGTNPNPLQTIGALFVIYSCFSLILIQVIQLCLPCAWSTYTLTTQTDSSESSRTLCARLTLQRDTILGSRLLACVIYIPGWAMLYCGFLTRHPGTAAQCGLFADCILVFPFLSLFLYLELVGKYRRRMKTALL